MPYLMKTSIPALAFGLLGATFSISTASADNSQPHTPPPPSNGSQIPSGTAYHPVYTGTSGSSAGVIVTTTPGTPASNGDTAYGVGFSVPLPGN
jgi:hypothetical protein